MRKLPVDISTFSRIKALNYLYVDKTEYMYKILTSGHRFFLSRPRRFGKSLLVSTFKEILTANRVLFDDLWIGSSDYNWQEYGVISLDFSRLEIDNVETMENGLKYALMQIARVYNIIFTASDNQLGLVLENLVNALSEKYGHVAILIDEYDSPILKTLYDKDLAQVVRNKIQQFFTTIKSLDAQVQFVFITGVSSFAKAGLFSGINNLQVLTLNKQFSGICGYSDKEVDHYFNEYICAWSKEENIPYDTLRQQIKIWYNGYRFGDNVVAVYNPFSLMNALHVQEFKNFWFQSGTPTFLIEVLKKEYATFDPEKLKISEDSLGIFDVGVTPLLSLMFQAGYLTISSYNPNSRLYTLDYPNAEVRISLQKYLLEVFAYLDPVQAEQMSLELQEAFEDENIEDAVELIQRLFAHVPYQLHSKEEKFYHALLMMVCIGAGIKTQSEYSTSHGRIDLVLEFPKIIYIIEVKFNQSADIALAQIEERRYYERFLGQERQLMLIGLSFTREPHNFTVTYASKKIS
ncbi:MAG TPA: AAA family ATPase [Candidatus Babeliales bacterium]|nr:AAA family ATPase [Candidatus Babeliales bacterium]